MYWIVASYLFYTIKYYAFYPCLGLHGQFVHLKISFISNFSVSGYPAQLPKFLFGHGNGIEQQFHISVSCNLDKIDSHVAHSVRP